jgi:hypothetical protein
MLEKELIVWWRFGKEHGEEDFRVNSQDVVKAHLNNKINQFKKTSAQEWRWYRIGENLLIERPIGYLSKKDTRIYYLLDQGMAVIENINLPHPYQDWPWYIHIADFEYRSAQQCWLKKDLFLDILVGKDHTATKVIDQDDLAEASKIGLITKSKEAEIIQTTDKIIQRIEAKEFPFPEIIRGQKTDTQINWN